jgi:hypothetical protein
MRRAGGRPGGVPGTFERWGNRTPSKFGSPAAQLPDSSNVPTSDPAACYDLACS